MVMTTVILERVCVSCLAPKPWGLQLFLAAYGCVGCTYQTTENQKQESENSFGIMLTS